MDYGIIEIVFSAIGAGVFFTLAFNFIWEVFPDKVLDLMDFKPLNCIICWCGWWGIILASAIQLPITQFFAFIGFAIISGSVAQNKLF